MSKVLLKYDLKKLKAHRFYDQMPANKYDLIKTVLSSRVDEALSDFLAYPQISKDAIEGKIDAYWSSNLLEDSRKPLTEFNEAKRRELKSQVYGKINMILRYAHDLLLSEDKKEIEWGQLLSKAIKFPGDEFIFSDGKNVCLTAWGFEYLNPPLKRKPYLEYFPVEKSLINDESSSVKSLPEKDKKKNKELEHDRTGKQDGSDGEPNKNSFTNNPEKTSLNSEESQLSESSELLNDDQGDLDIIDPMKDETSDSDQSDYPRLPWFKYLAMILAALAIMLLTYFLLSSLIPNLFGPSHGGKYSKEFPKLPNKSTVSNPTNDSSSDDYPKTTIEPFDPKDAKSDPDSISQVVPDRLNIVLKSSNQNLESFARAFKQMYPSDDYKIIYSDPTTFRLQIRIPEEEVQNVRKELKTKLRQFDLLIWHESIFTSHALFDDPGFDAEDQSWYFDEIQAYEAWNVTRGSEEVVIAVLDSGFDVRHPEIKNKLYRGWNAVTKSKVFPAVEKLIQHGTHVAALSGGELNNGKGVSGIAPMCKIMPIVVADKYGTISSTYVIDGILYALNHGANVINLSLGMFVDPLVANLSRSNQQKIINSKFKDEEAFWKELFTMAEARNITIVLAGGNQDVLIGIDPLDRSDYPIRVSATSRGNKKADFSNWGGNSDVSAPGNAIYSAIQNGRFDYLSGTSMAAPIVSGAVALMYSIEPNIHPKDIKYILKRTGIPTLTPSNKPVGEFLQIRRALDMLRDDDWKQDNCVDIQSKIDSLSNMIEYLKEQCQGLSNMNMINIHSITNESLFIKE